MVDYVDFSVEIAPKQGQTYPVVVRSPAGEGRGSFRLPFRPEEIGSLLAGLSASVRGAGREDTRHVALVEGRNSPEEVGQLLFNALFSDSVRSLLDRSLGMIHGQQRGLRIKLHIDPGEPSLALLAGLPWEFLYRRESREFLNLSRFTPLVRYLDIQRPYTPLPLTLPLRILAAMSAPAGCPELDLGRERERIERSWARQPNVLVEFLPHATVLALQDALAARHYHVLHYMGHGAYDAHSGRGALLMEDERGRADLVDGNRLGILLGDIPTMRLVFLNACETGRSTAAEGLDPFSGAASAMVMAGIPAVVAMQFPITDSAAITFAQRFYALVARGEPVDAAVGEGRRAIRLSAPETMEWGTPVLFMRAPEGVLFSVGAAGGAQGEQEGAQAAAAGAAAPEWAAPARPAAPDAEAERRLQSLYTDALGAYYLDDWERAARLFQQVLAARPDYRDAAARLGEAERQARLTALYAGAQAALEGEDWPHAIAALEETTSQQADYRDAAALLAQARQRHQLSTLYAEAQQLHEAGQWQAALNVLARIHALAPEHPDPQGLEEAARQELARLQREEQLESLYTRAVLALGEDHLPQARELLLAARALEPGYRESDALLARVEQKIAAAEEQARAEAQRLAEERAREEEFQRQEAEARRQAEERARQDAQRLAEEKAREEAQRQAEERARQEELQRQEAEARRQGEEKARQEAEARRQAELARQRAEKMARQGEPRRGEGLRRPRTGAQASAQPAPAQRASAVAGRSPTLRGRIFWLAAAGALAAAAVVWLALRGTIALPWGTLALMPAPGVTLRLVRVPAGPFLMGSSDVDLNAIGDEKPQHTVHLDEFYIGKTEVTVAQYRAFVLATGYSLSTPLPEGKEDHPVTEVNWYDAVAFCAWVSETTGRQVELPSEAEWEKAARGKDGRLYPWGDTWSADSCNTWDAPRQGTTPVGSFSPGGDSPYGCADMAGNVWEWTRSIFKGYPYVPGASREYPATGGSRVVRGGSWGNALIYGRSAYRSSRDPIGHDAYLGFRVVVLADAGE